MLFNHFKREDTEKKIVFNGRHICMDPWECWGCASPAWRLRRRRGRRGACRTARWRQTAARATQPQPQTATNRTRTTQSPPTTGNPPPSGTICRGSVRVSTGQVDFIYMDMVMGQAGQEMPLVCELRNTGARLYGPWIKESLSFKVHFMPVPICTGYPILKPANKVRPLIWSALLDIRWTL